MEWIQSSLWRDKGEKSEDYCLFGRYIIQKKKMIYWKNDKRVSAYDVLLNQCREHKNSIFMLFLDVKPKVSHKWFRKTICSADIIYDAKFFNMIIVRFNGYGMIITTYFADKFGGMEICMDYSLI